MDVTKTARRRRWLPPLILAAALVALVSGVVVGLTAATSAQRFIGWLIAAGAACTTVSAGRLLWWVRSGRGDPPTRR
jgi:hypothetical protein